MDDLDRGLEEDEAELLAAVEATVEDTSANPRPDGFYRTYLYCQYHHSGRHCRAPATVEINPEGSTKELSRRYLVCMDHSSYRPPMVGDRRWRAPRYAARPAD
jgi:hypothetical protein